MIFPKMKIWSSLILFLMPETSLCSSIFNVREDECTTRGSESNEWMSYSCAYGCSIVLTLLIVSFSMYVCCVKGLTVIYDG